MLRTDCLKLIFDQKLVRKAGNQKLDLATWGSLHLGVPLDHLLVDFIMFDHDEYTMVGVTEACIRQVKKISGNDMDDIASNLQLKMLFFSDLADWKKKYIKIIKGWKRLCWCNIRTLSVIYL